MKKALAIATPILCILVFAIFFIVAEANQPPDWESALERYLVNRNRFSDPDLSVQAVTKAKYPWNFSESMSALAIAESAHFHTFNYESSVTTAFPSYPGLEEFPNDGKAPLPYPPVDLWCVVLSGEQDQIIVFVAMHQDIYNADIVVHEAKGTLREAPLQANLAKVGCELP